MQSLEFKVETISLLHLKRNGAINTQNNAAVGIGKTDNGFTYRFRNGIFGILEFYFQALALRDDLIELALRLLQFENRAEFKK